MTTTFDPSTFLDVCASLDVSIGRQASALEELAKRPREQQPVQYRAIQSGPVPASGPLVLRLGGPDQGHQWAVRSIVVGGATPVTTCAGRVDVFVSAMDLRTVGTLAGIGLADWRDQAPALPNIAFYGIGELPLRLNEELFVIFSNATPGQQVTAAAQVLDFAEGPISLTWGLE